MSTRPWTVGPWAARPSKYESGVLLVQAGAPSNRVLAKFDGDGDGFDSQDEANARLISSSPDLAEALIAAREFIRNGIDLGYIRMPDADTEDPAHETAAKIDAALTKAGVS